MSRVRHPFQNFKVDHMTMLLQPQMYGVAYAVFRIIFGVEQRDVLYNRTKQWVPGEPERSMTFAVMVGNQLEESSEVDKTIFAMVQPTEPKGAPSHVRRMLDDHGAAVHWQHVALRTSDLLAFHEHARERGVNFITPILKDDHDDLIQVFSGEWFGRGMQASAVFFEFVQRSPSNKTLQFLEERNREAWFRDKTFLGLYEEKEMEYQRGNIVPFIDFALMDQIALEIGTREVYQLQETDFDRIEAIMIEYAAKREFGATHPNPNTMRP